ncbi:unnamed protein product [Mytilus coruscus]|uniref:Endonuclease/exonuclease/phosphatase domain-containing protein n=1 Tax=Mytilus coruscus TaxID=42192 RepID=A0A6J8CEV2_MYTCO|nr:unnamed protein product [Mytilus coruscus]
MINDNMKPMNDKIDKLNKNFENETKMLKNKLYEKDILIINLQSQIHESRDRIGKLQAEVKLQAQQIKDKDDNINDNEKQRQLNDKIISRLDVIDNKLKKQNATEQKSTQNDATTDIMYISKQPITSENNIVLHESKSNESDNYEEDNRIYTESKNYVDCSTLTNDLQYDEMVRPIETKVTDSYVAGFDMEYERNLCPAPLLQGRVGPKYTFRSKDFTKRSLLDYTCVPEYLSNDIFTLEIKSNCPYKVSDHYPVFVQMNIDLLSRTSNAFNINQKTLKWSKADDFELKMYQTEIDKLLNFETNSDNLSKGGVERFSSLLINALHMAANSCIPVGTFRPYLQPYWKNQNLNNSHFEQRNARRKRINNNKTREKTDLSYVEYKNENFVSENESLKNFGRRKNSRI